MSKNIGEYNYNSKEGKNEESYFYRFESIFIPIIPTFLVIIAAILFNKFSPKSNMNNKKIKDKKEDDNIKQKNNDTKNNTKKNSNSNKNKNKKGSLLGGNQRDNKKILESLTKSNFFMPIFKSIKKFKGFDNEEIEKTFNDYFEEQKIPKFFFMDCYNSINKYKSIENKESKNNNLIMVYYLDNNSIENEDIYNKNDLINDYEIIIFNYNSIEINLLFPIKRNIKKLSDSELLDEIKNSWCIKSIYEAFNINQNCKIGLSLNSTENKYNVYLVNNYITTDKNNSKSKENKNKNNNYIINNISSDNIIK